MNPTLPVVGQLAPDFRLKGPGGQFVTLSEYRGKHPVVLAFFPLAFSPACSQQLPMLERQMHRFAARGAIVLGISVDSHHANGAFASRLGLSFPLLSDFRRETSAAYGMLIESAGYAGRALWLVDREGRIAYRDVSPTPAEIPDPEPLLAVLEGLR